MPLDEWRTRTQKQDTETGNVARKFSLLRSGRQGSKLGDQANRPTNPTRNRQGDPDSRNQAKRVQTGRSGKTGIKNTGALGKTHKTNSGRE